MTRIYKIDINKNELEKCGMGGCNDRKHKRSAVCKDCSRKNNGSGDSKSYIYISNKFGEVACIDNSGRCKKLSGWNDGKGYHMFMLCLEGKQIHKMAHRLVAEQFIPNPLNLPFINHKNGIKNDNRVENLEWCTSSENNTHALKTGLRKPRVHEGGSIWWSDTWQRWVAEIRLPGSLGVNGWKKGIKCRKLKLTKEECQTWLDTVIATSSF